MRITVNGVIVSDDIADIYRYWGYQVACPSDIRNALAENPKDEELVIEINSGGGSVYAGFEMYSLIHTANVPTRVEVQSLAGSAASVIMAAADTVAVSPVGQVMIHLPSTITWGNQIDHKQSTQMLEAVTSSILSAYENKCKGKITRDRLRKMMDNETFITAEQALEYGLVDEIIGENSTVNYNNVINSMGGLPDIEKLREAYNKAKMSNQSQPTQSPDGDNSSKGAANKRAIAIAEASLNLNFI